MATFSVMTWNVENLFQSQMPATQFQAKIALLAAVIGNQGADVVALQEVGPEADLLVLKQAIGSAYPHHAIGLPDARGIRVAFLSKLAFTSQPENVQNYTIGPIVVNDLDDNGSAIPVTSLSRSALRIRVTKSGKAIDVMTVHLKSKLLTYRRPNRPPVFAPKDENERAQVAGIALGKRTAEAITVRTRANVLLEGNDTRALIVLGDFNDVPEAQTSLIMNGPSGSELGTQGFHRKDQGDDSRLFNVAPQIPADRRYSRISFGRKELIDQIFASEEFFPFVDPQHRRLPFADSLVDFNAQLPSINDDPTERTGAIAPDHAPVVATFEI